MSIHAPKFPKISSLELEPEDFGRDSGYGLEGFGCRGQGRFGIGVPGLGFRGRNPRKNKAQPQETAENHAGESKHAVAIKTKEAR